VVTYNEDHNTVTILLKHLSGGLKDIVLDTFPIVKKVTINDHNVTLTYRLESLFQ